MYPQEKNKQDAVATDAMVLMIIGIFILLLYTAHTHTRKTDHNAIICKVMIIACDIIITTMNRVTTVVKISRMMKMIALLHSYMHVRPKIYWKSSCVNIKCVYNTYVEKYSREMKGEREKMKFVTTLPATINHHT